MFFFQQVVPITVELGAAIVFAIITNILTGLGWWIHWRKYRTDTTLSVADRLPVFLQRLEEAHEKALEKATEEQELKRRLQQCLDGEITCQQLRLDVINFMTKIEPIIESIEECRELLRECRRFQKELGHVN